MSQRLNWEKANRQEAGKRPYKPRLTEIKPDRNFWELWRADKQAMKDSGYMVVKKHDGWHVFLMDAVIYED